MRKRMVSLLLCVVMLAGLLPTTAMAANDTTAYILDVALQESYYSTKGDITLDDGTVIEGTGICIQGRQDIVTVTIAFPSPVDVEIFIGTETVDQEHVTAVTTATAIDQRISLSGFSSEGRSDHLLPLGPVVVFALDVTGTLIELGLIV